MNEKDQRKWAHKIGKLHCMFQMKKMEITITITGNKILIFTTTTLRFLFYLWRRREGVAFPVTSLCTFLSCWMNRVQEPRNTD